MTPFAVFAAEEKSAAEPSKLLPNRPFGRILLRRVDDLTRSRRTGARGYTLRFTARRSMERTTTGCASRTGQK